MEIKNYYDFNDLVNACWSGAEDTLKTVEEYGYEDELMNFLESYYGDEIPTMTEVNDLLWFEDEWIFEQIGLDPNEDDEDDWDDEDEDYEDEDEDEKCL
jgi:hypothetical protein